MTFLLGTFFFLAVSRRPLKNPRCHGFYRFFVFEGVLLQVLDNQSFWFVDVLSWHQMISLILLLLSLFFVISGLFLLRFHGGSTTRFQAEENFAFENTATLVTTGIYRYIRHPMYGSLLLLDWGILLKHVSLMSSITAVVTTIFLFVTGYVEEKENIAFFGSTYQQYKKNTKMFIPFVF
jgi:protein-S-isoprenylcysteine O-methyltransferase Ste14